MLFSSSFDAGFSADRDLHWGLVLCGLLWNAQQGGGAAHEAGGQTDLYRVAYPGLGQWSHLERGEATVGCWSAGVS